MDELQRAIAAGRRWRRMFEAAIFVFGVSGLAWLYIASQQRKSMAEELARVKERLEALERHRADLDDWRRAMSAYTEDAKTSEARQAQVVELLEQIKQNTQR